MPEQHGLCKWLLQAPRRGFQRIHARAVEKTQGKGAAPPEAMGKTNCSCPTTEQQVGHANVRTIPARPLPRWSLSRQNPEGNTLQDPASILMQEREPALSLPRRTIYRA